MTIFDIETGPVSDDELRALMPAFVPPAHPGVFVDSSVRLGNLKDEKKIREKIEAARAEHAAIVADFDSVVASQRVKQFADFKREAALSPLTGQVLAIGFYPVDQLECAPLVFDSADEAELIRRFWQAWEDTSDEWAGWCIFGFDLPFLIRRSWRHGIRVPVIRVSNARYWSPRFIDLAERFTLGRYGEKVKLDSAAKFLRVGSKSGNGADFADLWKNDRQAATAYLINDLNITAGVAARMGFMPVDNTPAPW